MKKGWIAGLAVIILVGVILYMNQTGNTSVNEARPQKGFIAPDFTLRGEENSEVTLSELKGKPVFINFWASWCPPCKEEMPFIQEAYEKYGDQVVFLGINVTAGDSEEDALAFMKGNKYEMPILFDDKAEVTDLYRSEFIPTSFFIDKNGVITDKHVGPMNFSQIEAYLKKSMGE